MLQGCFQFGRRLARRKVFGRVEQAEVAADDLAGRL
jgi:hypothetical protein